MGNYTTMPKYKEVGTLTRSYEIETLTNGKGRNVSVTVSDENIFILYQDYSKKEKFMEKTFNFPLEIADMVLVFDWNGKPIKIYELGCFVYNICYDKARNRLWAFHHNEETLDPEIIYFEL